MYFRMHLWLLEKNRIDVSNSQYCGNFWIEMNVKQQRYYENNKLFLCTVGLWPYQSKISSYLAFLNFLILTSTSIVSKVTKRLFFLRRWKKSKYYISWQSGPLVGSRNHINCKYYILDIKFNCLRFWFFFTSLVIG